MNFSWTGCYWAINHLYNHDKTPFEKRKKNLFHCDMLQQAAGFREMQLQRSFLQTLQTRQLQLLLTDSMSPSAASAMTSVYPPGPPPPLVEDKRYSPASNIIEDKRSSTDSDPCSMLLEVRIHTNIIFDIFSVVNLELQMSVIKTLSLSLDILIS